MSQKSKVVLKSFFVIVLFALSLRAMATYMSPPASGTPPSNDNTMPPINAGSVSQVKSGDFGLTGNFVANSGVFNNGLSVSGSLSSAKYCFTGNTNCITSWPVGGSSQWMTSGSNIYYNIGNVTIGSTLGTDPLTVVTPTTQEGIKIQGSLGVDNVALSLSNTGTGGKTWGLYSTSGGSGAGQGSLAIYDGTTYRMVVNNVGNVGIGTTAPLAKLFVAGGAYNLNSGANNSSYALGAQSIAANDSIYSYGAICAGNSIGNCSGTGVGNWGTIIRGSGITFPDGTVQTTAATASTSHGEQLFLSTDSCLSTGCSFTVPTGVKTVWVTMVGGGGGGGGGSSYNTGGNTGTAGAGGGGGGVIMSQQYDVTGLTSVALTPGTPGTTSGGFGAGGTGTTLPNAYGSNGYPGHGSSFGTLTVSGGGGGTGGCSTACINVISGGASGGFGADAGVSNGGSYAVGATSVGTSGGATMFSSPDGNGYGAGGKGGNAGTSSSTSGVQGSNGKGGFVLVVW
jgi:hypothetical protein